MQSSPYSRWRISRLDSGDAGVSIGCQRPDAQALKHSGPVVILEHRALYDTVGDVPEEAIETPLGTAAVVRSGTDVTIVATSYMALEAMRAADELARNNVSAEVINLRSIRPLDEETILTSLKKTGRLITADTSWELCGVSSEVAALAAEKGFADLKAPVRRIALADCPAPVSHALEKVFYPSANTMTKAAMLMVGKDHGSLGHIDRADTLIGPY